MNPSATDIAHIQHCIALSEAAVQRGDAPFGSLIARGDEIISEGINNKNFRISEHAEIIALNLAAEKTGQRNLEGCTLYTSCEPCPMCSFMIREFHISRVVFAMHSPHMGGFNRWPILQDTRLRELGPIFGAPVEVNGGVLEAEARAVMAKTFLIDYFRT